MAPVRVQNAGVPLLDVQFPKTVLAFSAAKVAVSVPAVVTGEFVTEKMEGSDKPTLVTVPSVSEVTQFAPMQKPVSERT
jgi:hypothetical protein